MNIKPLLIILILILGGTSVMVVFANTTNPFTAPYQITDSNGNVVRLTIDSLGNIGIGTTSPNQPLTVNLGAANNGIESLVTSSGNEATVGLINTAAGGKHYQIMSTGGSSGLGQGGFYIYDLTSGATRIGITSAGNVGIGTSSPNQQLDVAGNIRLTGNIVSPNDICIGTC